MVTRQRTTDKVKNTTQTCHPISGKKVLNLPKWIVPSLITPRAIEQIQQNPWRRTKCEPQRSRPYENFALP